jgi:signal transduction histidine kinase
MNRPLHIWLLFGLCVAVLMAAMGWVSFTALQLDRSQAETRRQADFEEKVRLALWRMDSALAPLVAQETSLPYFYYQPFYSADRAYTRMFDRPQPGEVLLPSPLLMPTSSNVLLHFQFDPAGRLNSPQVPADAARIQVENRYVKTDQIDRMSRRLQQLQNFLRRDVLWAKCPPAAPSAPGNIFVAQVAENSRQMQSRQQAQIPSKKAALAQQEQQVMFNTKELEARAQNYQQAAQVNFDNIPKLAVSAHVVEGAARPVWLGQELVLARRVTVEGQDYLQGCWLNWPGLRQTLLASVSDLLPGAQLEPLESWAADPQMRLLASLPIRLSPGPIPMLSSHSSSAIHVALGIAWSGAVLAALAVGALLYGAVSLSERRGAFVSAVTHELRTPLTTFKMYSEMLAEGMVTEATKRQQYLGTLCAEANRLSHLVENVLAYARLERGNARCRLEKITLKGLLQRVKPRLVQRAEQAGMRIAEDAEAPSLETWVQVDVSAVEQILFNLVDNACKYAAPTATEKVVHLETFAIQGDRCAMIRVRDHGQGISSEMARRLFKPFSKSAYEAAQTAPGVGLGLALCRRLSQRLGGDLRWNSRHQQGACFELRLRVIPGFSGQEG